MKTFNLNKPFDELSFDEILPIIVEIADEMDICKKYEKDKTVYSINAIRGFKDYDNNDEFELSYLSFKWTIDINDKSKDSFENQNQKTIGKLDSYIESAMNLKLIDLNFIENE